MRPTIEAYEQANNPGNLYQGLLTLDGTHCLAGTGDALMSGVLQAATTLSG
jgi:hypothetical protein